MDIVFDKRIRSAERWYWRSFDHDQSLLGEFELVQNNVKKQLSEYFQNHRINFNIIDIQDTDYLTPLQKLVEGEPKSVIVIEDNEITRKHPIFQSLSTISADILLLCVTPWHNTIKMLGAVDPLHEHARPLNIDEHIVHILRQWNEKLVTEWSIAHCCFISSVLYKHEKTILKMHREEFSAFAKKLKVSSTNMHFLQGHPEDALDHYIKINNIDILVIGLVARSVLEKMWIGSTTVALMHNPPCDILLVSH